MGTAAFALKDGWFLAPEILRELDADPYGKYEIRTRDLLRNCLAYIPTFERSIVQLMGLSSLPDRWRLGRRGEGDIAPCFRQNLTALGYLETKGSETKVSWGRECPNRCDQEASQFQHMAHTGVPILVVAPSRTILLKKKGWHEEGLPASAIVRSYSAMADLVEVGLRDGNLPSCSLLEALFDVERVNLPKS